MKCNAIYFNSLLHLTCFCCFELLSSVAVTAQTVHNCSGARTNEHCVVGCGAGFQGTSVTNLPQLRELSWGGSDPRRLQNMKVEWT